MSMNLAGMKKNNPRPQKDGERDVYRTASLSLSQHSANQTRNVMGNTVHMITANGDSVVIAGNRTSAADQMSMMNPVTSPEKTDAAPRYTHNIFRSLGAPLPVPPPMTFSFRVGWGKSDSLEMHCVP